MDPTRVADGSSDSEESPKPEDRVKPFDQGVEQTVVSEHGGDRASGGASATGGSIDVTVGVTGASEGPASERSLHPERVGDYVIEKLLGAGGMGSVYLGRHAETGELAAVKLLPASLARETGFIERFDREVAALEKLDCPQVVKLLESGADDLPDGSKLHYYAMEFVAGETLTERLKRDRRIPWPEVIDIGSQVCKALKAAHNAGIIHRDLKPSNLMLGRDGEVKLADFGVAQIFASSKLTVTGGILGTAEYMSPEQAEGRRVTKESDIYSLGALLYAALTGRPPFSGRTPMDIAQKHRTGQFDAPKRWVEDIPHWLDEVVCKCLAKKPEDRYPDAHIVHRRLEEIPKKLALATAEATGGHTAATVSATGEPQVVAGGATFAAEMMRAEIESEKRGTVLRRLLDSTSVLLALFALLLGIGYVMTRPKPINANELFARGETLMQQRSLESMRTARDDYFLPLLAIDKEYWEPKIEPYLRKVDLAEVTRGVRTLRGSHHPKTEPQRLLQVAIEQRRSGLVFEADQTLSALRELVRYEPEQAELVNEIDNLRGELVVQLAELDRQSFIAKQRAQADSLEAAGKLKEAQAIRDAITSLYNSSGDEPGR